MLFPDPAIYASKTQYQTILYDTLQYIRLGNVSFCNVLCVRSWGSSVQCQRQVGDQRQVLVSVARVKRKFRSKCQTVATISKGIFLFKCGILPREIYGRMLNRCNPNYLNLAKILFSRLDYYVTYISANFRQFFDRFYFFGYSSKFTLGRQALEERL